MSFVGAQLSCTVLPRRLIRLTRAANYHEIDMAAVAAQLRESEYNDDDAEGIAGQGGTRRAAELTLVDGRKYKASHCYFCVRGPEEFTIGRTAYIVVDGVVERV